MADLIRGDYDQLDQIAAMFANQADEIQQLLQKVRSGQDRLKGNWIGRGSDAFFGEMEELVLPKTMGLQKALTTGSDITKQISAKLKTAEREASSLFQNE